MSNSNSATLTFKAIREKLDWNGNVVEDVQIAKYDWTNYDSKAFLNSIISQGDVETVELYKEAKEKFDMFHICVESGCYPNQEDNLKSFQKVMGEKHAKISSVNEIKDTIIDAIKYYAKRNTSNIIVEDVVKPNTDNNGEIGW